MKILKNYVHEGARTAATGVYVGRSPRTDPN